MKNSSLIRESPIKRSQSSLQIRVDTNWLEDIKKAIKKHRKFKSQLKKKDKEAEQKS